MENVYRLDEYKEQLPNPKGFPIKGALITKIKGMPLAFTDTFMLDLSVGEDDVKILKEKAMREVPGETIRSILEEAGNTPLSEPEYIHDDKYISYIVFTPGDIPIVIQIKYYKYFRNRYNNCKFYCGNDRMDSIAVRRDNKIIGIIMPVFVTLKGLERVH